MVLWSQSSSWYKVSEDDISLPAAVPFHFHLSSINRVPSKLISRPFCWKLTFLHCDFSNQGTCPITRSFENTILKFFCKWTNKIQGSTMQLLKNLKPFELTWPFRIQPSNLWMLLLLENLFFAKNIVIG